MATYKIPVTRTASQTRDFDVEAASFVEAKEAAYNAAADYDWGAGAEADYKAHDIQVTKLSDELQKTVMAFTLESLPVNPFPFIRALNDLHILGVHASDDRFQAVLWILLMMQFGELGSVDLAANGVKARAWQDAARGSWSEFLAERVEMMGIAPGNRQRVLDSILPELTRRSYGTRGYLDMHEEWKRLKEALNP